MKAMILAAGLGSRLKPFTDEHPKALAIVGGKTLLEHALRFVAAAGIREIVVNVHHFADQIEEHLNHNNNFGLDVRVSDERDTVLETGGGLKKAAHFFEGEKSIVVMNVDVFTTLDLGAMIAHHNNGDAGATLAVMDRSSSRNLLFDKEMRLCGWKNNKTGEERQARQADGPTRAYAFSGIQIVDAALLSLFPEQEKFSLIDAYLKLAGEGKVLRGYDHSQDTFIDVGKPETLAEANILRSRF